MANNTTRSAYTLIEMIFVMVILVLAAALAVPATQSVMVDARISAAADMVRSRIADARASATEQGRPWRIGYLPDTGVFQIAPDDATDWNNASSDCVEQQDLLRDKLPRDIVFTQSQSNVAGSQGSSSQGSSSQGSSSQGSSSQGSGNQNSSAQNSNSTGSAWQTIAVFMPEGNALDDTLTCFGKTGIVPMRVRVRALTGAVSIEAATTVLADQQP